jgi:hypothetical protein
MTDETNRPLALITGASSGIGEGFARELAKRGHDLLITARRKDRLDTLAAELATQHGAHVEAIQANLALDEGVALLEERLRSSEVELLVNNAGFGSVGEYITLPLERELEELDVNVRALMRLSHAGLTAMAGRKRGAIINVASMAGFQPIPYNATYSASKAFVLHFSEALHEEAKEHKVTVTCLCPGPVKTEFQQIAGTDESRVPAMMWTTVEQVVESALSAVRFGCAIAVPGPLNAMTAGASLLAPRFLRRRIAGNFHRDRSK